MGAPTIAADDAIGALSSVPNRRETPRRGDVDAGAQPGSIGPPSVED
jgi:hypothetical protein